MNYEDAIKELEEITTKLDSEILPLGESEKLFEIKKEFDKITEEEVE